VVRWALRHHDGKGIVLDPFTGSGTVQLEALAKGITSVGIDIDPLACLVAQAKTTPLNPETLRISVKDLGTLLAPFEGLHSNQEAEPGEDIDDSRFEDERLNLIIPNIRNITHWFRRYVIIDLALIFWAIDALDLTSEEKRFFKVCAASIIRRVSNADPAPVSGLEVTSVQMERNRERRIQVFRDFFSKVEQGILGMEALHSASVKDRMARARVVLGDTLDMARLLEREHLDQRPYSLAITSPPYCRSVEYSRRHQLEMYWLGLVENQAAHVALKHRYIGRAHVRKSDWNNEVDFDIPELNETVSRIEAVDPHKARAVRHYFRGMDRTLSDLSSVLTKDGTMVWVVGDSISCGEHIRTADFIAELARQHWRLTNRFTYALRNHYMQYGLWNGAGIKEEHVLILQPRKRRRSSS